MNKVLATIAALTMLATPAMAKCDVYDLIMDGILSRGSLKCNPDWLDRSASLIEVERARDCQGLDGKHIRAFIARGMHDFDRKLNELGRAKACQKLDEIMTSIEGAASR